MKCHLGAPIRPCRKHREITFQIDAPLHMQHPGCAPTCSCACKCQSMSEHVFLYLHFGSLWGHFWSLLGLFQRTSRGLPENFQGTSREFLWNFLGMTRWLETHPTVNVVTGKSFRGDRGDWKVVPRWFHKAAEVKHQRGSNRFAVGITNGMGLIAWLWISDADRRYTAVETITACRIDNGRKDKSD